MLEIKNSILKEKFGSSVSSFAIYVRSEYADGFMRFTLGNTRNGHVLLDKFFIYDSDRSTACFLGIVKALELINNKGVYRDYIVQADNQEAVGWIMGKKCHGKSTHPGLVELVEASENWLKDNEVVVVEYFNAVDLLV